MTLSLATSLLAPVKVAAQPPPTASPSAKNTTPPTPFDSAKAEAKRAGRQVEIPSLHTESSTTYANSDGKTLTTEFHTDPIRYKQGDAWQQVDTTLVADNGTIKPRATKADLTLSHGGGTDLLTTATQRDGSTIKISAPEKLSAPKLSGNRAEYANAYGPGIDLAVIATPTGFRQEVVIRQRPVNALKLPVSIQLPAGLSFDKTASGKLALQDDAGKAKRRTTEIPAPQLIDASADLSVGEEGRVGKVATAVEKTAAGQTLTYKPDASFLADPDVTYPVTFVAADTEWTELPVGNDTFINNSSYQNGYANSGAYHVQAGKTNEGTVRWRTYIRFEEIPEDSPLRGGRVTNADLVLWNIASNDCGERVGSGITARRITQRWDVSTLTWSRQPTVTSEGANTEYGAYSPGCGRGYMDYEWDLYHSVNAIVQKWADGEPNYGFQLTAGDESDYTNWRAYRSNEYGEDGNGSHGPKLVIGYEPTIVDVDTWQYDEFEPTSEQLNDMYARQTEDTVAPFQIPTEEESREAALASPQYVVAKAEDLVPPADLTQEEREWEATQTGPGFEESPEPEEPDETPPTVMSNPGSGDVGVPTDVKIRVAFSEPVTGQTFALKESAGTDVPLTVTALHEQENEGFELTPQQPLKAGTGYRLEVRAAMDANGHTMSDYTASFTTKGDGTTPACTVPAWSATEDYYFGDVVSFKGNVWQVAAALEAPVGVEPDQNWIWRDLGACEEGGQPIPTPTLRADAKEATNSQDRALAAADDDARVVDCWNNEAEARSKRAGGYDGYLAGRLNWCAIQNLTSGSLSFGPPPPGGDTSSRSGNGITATVTTIGYTYPAGKDKTDRVMQFRISLKNVIPIGLTYKQKAYIAFGSKSEDGCKTVGDTYIQGKWDEWSAGKTASFAFQSEESNGIGPDKVEHCHPKFYAKVWLPDIPSTRPQWFWSDATPQVRCDSATYISKLRGSGCVFDKAQLIYETTETYRGDPWQTDQPLNVETAYRNVPGHIWTAFNKPHLTLPTTATNKMIPGSINGPYPGLVRTVRSYWKEKNNEKVRKLCRILFPEFDRKDPVLGKPATDKDGNPVPPADRRVYECDEYPFESTIQGAWTSRQKTEQDGLRYSIRPVYWRNNGRDGSQLGSFYNDNRVLGVDGKERQNEQDRFFVDVKVPGY